jgi:hypothetical protein
MVAPAISIWLLIRQKPAFIGITRHNLIRFNIYFFILLIADIERTLTQNVIATYVTLVCFFLVAMNFGHAAAVVQFCPEARTWPESMRIIFKRTMLFPLFLMLLGAWLAVTLAFSPVAASLTLNGASGVEPSFPLWYTVFTIIVAVPITVYPALLLVSSLRRVQVSYTKNSLLMMLFSWFAFPTVGLLAFFLLDSVVPFSYELGLIGGTIVYCILAISIRSVPATRFLKSSLFPQGLINIGKRYLVLHDEGLRTLFFLSSAFRSAINSGAKVIISSSATWLLDGLSKSDTQFSEWRRSGKLTTSLEAKTEEGPEKERISERLVLSQAATVSVKELDQQDLQHSLGAFGENPRTKEPEAEVLLLESSKAPRLQVAEFLEKNKDIELVNLSQASDPFSMLVNLDHQKLEGSKILMEYTSNANVEELVNKFFDESVANAEFCALFTSKSSMLYRALKGKRTVKVVAASSLVSAPDEMPDGEIQIPDKELGLVTSLLTEFYENNRSVALSLVFDSIGELIRGERWEQVYSGIKQLIELTTPSSITAMFLINTDTTEPRFLGALRGLFSVQMKLGEGTQSLRVTKSD